MGSFRSRCLGHSFLWVQGSVFADQVGGMVCKACPGTYQRTIYNSPEQGPFCIGRRRRRYARTRSRRRAGDQQGAGVHRGARADRQAFNSEWQSLKLSNKGLQAFPSKTIQNVRSWHTPVICTAAWVGIWETKLRGKKQSMWPFCSSRGLGPAGTLN